MPDDSQVTNGDGYAVVADLEGLGDGYGFRKVRRGLEVTAFGANVIVIPPGFQTGAHFHDEQEELYFVHRGGIEMAFGDGTKHELREGGTARVDASTHRSIRNLSDSEDAVYLVVGGKGGYVGRDGRVPEDETAPPGPHGDVG